MAGEPTVTIVGNLGDDPALRFTPSGAAVCNFSVANTPRRFNKETQQWEDGTPTWFACAVWREFAENVAETLVKGSRVIVTGRLTTREWEGRDGQKGRTLELEVDAIGPDLRWAVAKVSRSHNGAGGQQRQQSYGSGSPGHQPQERGRQGSDPSPAADPWGTPGAGSDEPPF